MKPRCLAVCPSCHEFYAIQKDTLTHSCNECGCMLKPVDYDFGIYSALSDEEKKNFKRKYIADHFPKAYQKPFKPMPQSGWVGFMGCCGWFAVIGLLIAGFFTFLFGSYGAGIILMISAPISGGVLILFSIVAEDVRHIRNQVDKLHYDREHQS